MTTDKCPHCGLIHEMTCPRIKSIEYHEFGGMIKRIEFHSYDVMPLTDWTSSHKPGCPRLTAAGDPPCTCPPVKFSGRYEVRS